MTPDEFTMCFNLAKALDLVVSSRQVNGTLYVYSPQGFAYPWESFIADYPLERLQAMVNRRQIKS